MSEDTRIEIARHFNDLITDNPDVNSKGWYEGFICGAKGVDRIDDHDADLLMGMINNIFQELENVNEELNQ
jgi:hypothetical protein